MHTNNPRTLFIVYFDLGIGGVQRKIIDIVNRMHADRRHRNVRVRIFLADKKNNIFLSAIHNPQCRLNYKRYHRFPWWVLITFYALLEAPDSILTFLPVPAYQVSLAIRVLFWKKIRFVIGNDVITSHAFARGDFGADINQQLPFAYTRADAILVPSVTVAHDLISHYRIPDNRIIHTPNWTTITIHKRTTPKTVDCVYVGRFDGEKRLPLLLRVTARIHKLLPDASLLLVGSGRESDRITEEIARYGLKRNVTVSKPRTDIPTILERAKIAVYASESEGTPMFLLEAMAAGLPVVAMYFAGIDNIITHEKTGYICRTTTQFVSRVTALLKNPDLRQTMGRSGRDLIRHRYSADNLDTYIRRLFTNTI